MGVIVSVSSNPHRHQHNHLCRFCGKVKYEDNSVCRKEFDHEFFCMDHLQYIRDSWGMIDCLVGTYLSTEEQQRLDNEWQPSKS
jgi:hypothetical protein